MYVNAKMIAVETVPGIRRGGMKESSGVNLSMIYLIHCKNLSKCYNVPPPSIIMIIITIIIIIIIIIKTTNIP
jgi:hypothetical protein